MATAYFAQQLLNGLFVSMHYALLAMAYVLIHSVTGQINLAFGSFSIWAGYIVINLSLLGLPYFPGDVAVVICIAAGLAIASTLGVGLTAGRLIFVPLTRAPTLAILVASLGLAIVLEEVMRLANMNREVWLMPVLSEPVHIYSSGTFPVQVTRIQVLVFLGCVAVGLTLRRFIHRSRFGRDWKACSDDLGMASLCGVDAGRTVVGTLLLSSGLAAIAGAVMALQYGSVSFYVGLLVSLKTLFVAVLGGLRSLRGAVAGALMLGMVEAIWSAWFDIAYRDVVAFALLTGLMILFPSGLFTPAGRVDVIR